MTYTHAGKAFTSTLSAWLQANRIEYYLVRQMIVAQEGL